MRTLLSVLFAVALVSVALAGADNSGVEYYTTVSNYFDIPVNSVADLADQVTDNELPVVFYIADRGKVSVEKVLDLHTSGASWFDVAADCNLNAADFYVMVVGKIGSKTFGPIYDLYNGTPMPQWKKLTLTDDAIVNLVNLRLVASSNDYSPFEVMAMRDYNTNWSRVNHKAVLAKTELLKREMAKAE